MRVKRWRTQTVRSCRVRRRSGYIGVQATLWRAARDYFVRGEEKTDPVSAHVPHRPSPTRAARASSSRITWLARSRVCLTRQSRHHAPGRPFSTSRTDSIIGQYIIIGRAVLDEGPITRTLAPFPRRIRRRSEKHGVELAPAGRAHRV